MPADRFLHPRIGDSEKVARLTDMEFRVWIAYLLAADDFGVLPMTAAKIQGADRTLGARKKPQIDRALEAIVSIGLVRTFTHQGARFIYSASWQKHQRVRYPRKSHYPAPPREDVELLEKETSALFLKFHGDFAETDRESSGEVAETFQTPARAGACEVANGKRLEANPHSSEGSVRGTPPMDVWARELVNLYPAQGRCGWNLVERPLFAALTGDGGDPFATWELLRAALEQHKRSHQWRVKQMIPRLDKWLRESLFLQELPEHPVSTLVSEKTARSLSSADAFIKGGDRGAA